MNPKKLLRKVAPKQAIRVAEESYRKSRLGVTHISYGLPARNLRVIAVTGTNGKTSTCNFLNDVLKSAGFTTALFTTAVIEMAGGRKINTNHTTVPKTKDLFKFLQIAKIKNVDFVILEVTSHALHQHKLWGIPIEIAVMTNISQDHLDYHGTMQRYADAKARLFNNYLNPKICILNRDDEWYDFFAGQSVGRVLTYGKSKESDIRISSCKSSAKGLSMRLDTTDHSIIASAQIVGDFNGYNLGAVTAICEALELKPDVIRKGLESVGAVPGRMEMIRSSKGFTVVVDYAHAPDALEKALQALRATTKGRVSVVFGATGDRDTTKRPIMGKVASENADHIYLTDDETYTEDGKQIRKAVLKGIIEAGGKAKTTEIADRREAIKKSIEIATKDDMILVAGLGHQNYRAMKGANIEWQETEVVKDILRELNRE